MTKLLSVKTFAAMAAAAFVTACGTTVENFTALTESVGDNAKVTVITLDPGAMSTGTLTGTYVYADGEVSTDGGILVDASSVLSNSQSSTRYSYVAGLDTTDDYKLIALVTNSSNLPSNTTVTYLGQALVTVTDSSATYDGTMESTVTAKFGTAGNTVDLALANMTNATVTDTSTSAYTATGSEDITISGMAISGSTYGANGSTTAVVDGFGTAISSIATGGATISASGVFAGNSGTETAGTATIDAVGDETVLISFSGVDD